MKSFNDTEQCDLVIEDRIPPSRQMVTALPDREQQLAAHAAMIAEGFRYDPAMRAWVKRVGANAVSEWIEPSDRDAIGVEYWITRRSADAAPGYDLGLPSIRVRYRWNGVGWITGYYQEYRNGIESRRPKVCILHSNNGWRLEQEQTA